MILQNGNNLSLDERNDTIRKLSHNLELSEEQLSTVDNNILQILSQLSSDNLKLDILLDNNKSDLQDLSQKLAEKDNKCKALTNDYNLLTAQNDTRSIANNQIDQLNRSEKVLNKTIASLQNIINNKDLEIFQANEIISANKEKLEQSKEEKISMLKEIQSLKNNDYNLTLSLESLQKQLMISKENESKISDKFYALSKQSIIDKNTEFNANNSIDNNNYPLIENLRLENSGLKKNNELLLQNCQTISNNLQDQLLTIKSLNDELSLQKSNFLKEMNIKEKINIVYQDQINSLREELTERNNNSLNSNKLINKIANNKTIIQNYKDEIENLNKYIQNFINTDSENNNTIIKNTNNDVNQKMLLDLKKKLLREKSDNRVLKKQVENFVLELENKLPILNSFEKRTKSLERELISLTSTIDEISVEKEKILRENINWKRKFNDSSNNIKELRIQRNDLANQIQFLLLVQPDNNTLDKEQIQFIKRILINEDTTNYKDYQKIISDRLLNFKNIRELQEQNMNLVKTIRGLMDKLESTTNCDNKNLSDEKTTIQEAKETIINLNNMNSQLEEKIEILTREKNAFKVIFDDENSNISKRATAQENLKSEINILKEKLKEQESQYNMKCSSLNGTINENKNTINTLNSKISRLTTQNNSFISELTQIKESHKSLTESSQLLKYENNLLNEKLSKTTQNYDEISNTLNITKKALESYKLSLSNSQSVNSSLSLELENLQKTILENSEIKSTLETSFQCLQSKYDVEIKNKEKIKTTLSAEIDRLHSEYKILDNKYSMKEQELSDILEKQKLQDKWLHNNIDSLSDEINTKNIKIDELQAKIIELEKNIDRLKKIPSNNKINEAHPNELLEKEIAQLKVELKSAEYKSLAYMDLADSNEDTIKSLTETFEQTLVKIRQEKDVLEKENSKLQAEISKNSNGISSMNQAIKKQEERLNEEKNDLENKKKKYDDFEKHIANIKKCHNEEIGKLNKELKSSEIEKRSLEEKLISKETDLNEAVGDSVQLKEKFNSLNSKYIELNNLLSNLEIVAEERDSLERQLDSANQRIETLTSQNFVLMNDISKDLDNVDTEKMDPNVQLVIHLKNERDSIQRKADLTVRDANILREQVKSLKDQLSKIKGELSLSNNASNTTIINNHQRILDSISEMNILKKSNTNLQKEIDSYKEEFSTLQVENEKYHALQIKLDEYKTNESTREQEIKLFKEESARWKQMAQQLSEKRPEEQKMLLDEITELKNKVETTTSEKIELEDKFSRLKKQAHEKLDSSREINNTLTSQLNDANNVKESLQKKIEEQQEKLNEFELNKEKNENVDQLKEELANALAKTTELEARLQENSESFAKNQQELQAEVEELKNRSNVVPSETNDNMEANVDEKIKTLKETFEKEKESLISEMKTKYENNEGTEISENNAAINKLKSKWEEEWERKTLTRIEDAKEALKRHIRLPSEEKLQRIVEKRKAQLETEFDKKVEARAKLFKLSDTLNKPADVIKDEIREETKAELEEEFNNIKKKAFEEGKQQASMKTTLLERKISKLESQLQDKSTSSTTTSMPQTANRKSLSKIDVRNPFSASIAFTSKDKTEDSKDHDGNQPPKSLPITEMKALNDTAQEEKPKNPFSFAPVPTFVSPSPLNISKPTSAASFGFQPAFSFGGTNAAPTFGSLVSSSINNTANTSAALFTDDTTNDEAASGSKRPSREEGENDVAGAVPSQGEIKRLKTPE